MPILEAVVGGLIVGKVGLAASATVGGMLVAAGHYFFGQSMIPNESEETKAKLARLTATKIEREEARINTLDEMVNELVVQEDALHQSTVKIQNQMDTTVHGIANDQIVIHEQNEQLTKTNAELEQCVQQQRNILSTLQQELQKKMASFDQVQQELFESKTHFEQTAKELTESKERIDSSAQELQQLKKELWTVSSESKQKEEIIKTLSEEVKGMQSNMDSYREGIKQAQTRNTLLTAKVSELVSTNRTYKTLVQSLTQQLTDKEENSPELKTPTSSIHAFF